ncbi:MAG: ATP-binding cassette domain-containing protein [Marmoricola sp.]
MSTELIDKSASVHDIVYDISNVTLRFGGVTSLNDVTLQMRRGEILAIIGPNGAGKTSLFNCLTGVYTPQEGVIKLSGRKGDSASHIVATQGLVKKSRRSQQTHKINHMGVARTYQGVRLFPALTALENVKIAVETRQGLALLAPCLGCPGSAKRNASPPKRPMTCSNLSA